MPADFICRVSRDIHIVNIQAKVKGRCGLEVLDLICILIIKIAGGIGDDLIVARNKTYTVVCGNATVVDRCIYGGIFLSAGGIVAIKPYRQTFKASGQIHCGAVGLISRYRTADRYVGNGKLNGNILRSVHEHFIGIGRRTDIGRKCDLDLIVTAFYVGIACLTVVTCVLSRIGNASHTDKADRCSGYRIVISTVIVGNGNIGIAEIHVSIINTGIDNKIGTVNRYTVWKSRKIQFTAVSIRRFQINIVGSVGKVLNGVRILSRGHCREIGAVVLSTSASVLHHDSRGNGIVAVAGNPASVVGRCSCQRLLTSLPCNRTGYNTLSVHSAHNDGIFIRRGCTGIGSRKIVNAVNLGFHGFGIGSESVCCNTKVIRTVQKEFSVGSQKLLNASACSEVGIISFIPCGVLRS